MYNKKYRFFFLQTHSSEGNLILLRIYQKHQWINFFLNNIREKKSIKNFSPAKKSKNYFFSSSEPSYACKRLPIVYGLMHWQRKDLSRPWTPRLKEIQYYIMLLCLEAPQRYRNCIQYEKDDARLYFVPLEFIKSYINANYMRLGVKFSIVIILFHNSSFLSVHRGH